MDEEKVATNRFEFPFPLYGASAPFCIITRKKYFSFALSPSSFYFFRPVRFLLLFCCWAGFLLDFNDEVVGGLERGVAGRQFGGRVERAVDGWGARGRGRAGGRDSGRGICRGVIGGPLGEGRKGSCRARWQSGR